jgi:outer membrane protein TolC
MKRFFLPVFLLATAFGVAAQDPTPTPIAQPTVSPTPPIFSNPPAQLPDDPPPVAPNFQAPLRPLPSTERVGVDNANQLSLSLEEAIERALRNNNNIDVARNNVQIAEFNLRGSRGVYDPIIGGESYYESATTPQASIIAGATGDSITQRRFFNSAGVTGFSRFGGGEYSALYNTSRLTSTSTNPTLNPQYPANITLSYSQPLLRNFSFDNNRRQIEIARKNLSLSDAQFRQQAIDVIAAVEQAYWDLAFALRNLQVQIDAVKQARTQVESNQRQVEKGVLPPIDLVAANAQIVTFEQAVYAAQESVTRSENTLKSLMLAERSAAEWSRPITPVSPISLDAPQIGLEIATTDALKNRPEIAALETNSEINKIDERYYRNQTKPQIDIVGTYTSQGLAGTAWNPDRLPPETLRGGYLTTWGQIFSQNYPTYRAGVQISLPWGNTTAKANLGRTLVERDRIANQRAQAEQIIEAEVRNALQALRSAEARLQSAAAARVAAEQLYASEQRQFQAGTTTFFLVQQRQTELVTARGRELQAQTDLNRAISEFQRSIGSTLTANNVTVSSGGTLTKIPSTSSRFLNGNK